MTTDSEKPDGGVFANIVNKLVKWAEGQLAKGGTGRSFGAWFALYLGLSIPIVGPFYVGNEVLGVVPAQYVDWMYYLALAFSIGIFWKAFQNIDSGPTAAELDRFAENPYDEDPAVVVEGLVNGITQEDRRTALFLASEIFDDFHLESMVEDAEIDDPKDVVEATVAFLDYYEEETREKAADTLQTLSESYPRAVMQFESEIMERLDDESEEVVNSAIFILTNIYEGTGDEQFGERARDVLVELVDHPSPSVRGSLGSALDDLPVNDDVRDVYERLVEDEELGNWGVLEDKLERMKASD